MLDDFEDFKGNIIRHSLLSFVKGQRGCKLLAFNGHNYVRNRRSGLKTYWICSKKGSTKCSARVVTNVIDGVHKIVLESCHHTCLNVDRKKRLSLVSPLVKTNARAKTLASFIKTETDEDLTLELRSLNLSIEDLQQLQ